MGPSQQAIFLPEPGEAFRKATAKGLEQAAILIKKDEEKKEARMKVKLEQEENSPESLFMPHAIPSETTTHRSHTSLSSGPYAGLISAKKRVRDDMDLDESHSSLGPKKKVAREAEFRQNVDLKEETKSSFGPAKKLAKRTGVLKNVQVVNTRTMDEGPEWYDTVDSKQTYSRGDLQDLKYLYTLMNNARKDAAEGKALTQSLEKIRQRLQQMEFYTSLSLILVKKSNLLDDRGLRVFFENSIENVNIPHDIRADADILFRKWMSGQIDPHLFRGIETRSGTGKEDRRFKSHSIQQDFAGKVSCNYVGAGNLVNGQWWPLQTCAKRDGAHGEIEAGIHGQKGKGAYSVVVSGGGYANLDNGDSIEYCGTQGTENSPSAGTSLMLKAHETQQPLRVLRSASLPTTNPYRPSRGIRYDGLYHITSHEILDQKTAMYRFSLARVGAQDAIRYSGEGMIPSNAQILELNKIRERLG